MRQRLGIADALVKDPDILILDEPTTAIDPLGVVDILDLLRGLARDSGLAILLASHLLDQVQSVCDRIGIFAPGQLIGEGTVEDLAAAFDEATAGSRSPLRPTEAAGRWPATAMVHRGRGRRGPRRPAGPPQAPGASPWRPARTNGRSGAILAAAVGQGCASALRPLVPSLDDIYRPPHAAVAGASVRRGHVE